MTTPKPALARVLKRLHYPFEVIRMDFCCVPIVTSRDAARRYFEKSIGLNGGLETVAIDTSGANLGALGALNAERETPIKPRTRPMPGFRSFRCARILLSGIELMHMIAKGKMEENGIEYSRAKQTYSLAA